MSRELRVIPPFHVPSGLHSLFAEAVLHFGDRHCPVDERIVLDRDEFAGRDARIVWAGDHHLFRRSLEKGLAEIDLTPADTVLLVLVKTSYLGLVSEALRVSLDDIRNLDPEASLETAALRSARNRGARVRAFLLLKHETERRPLRPWRKGTCLARAEFVVATDWLGQLFSLKALDAETRRELDLPDSAMRYVRLGDHDPLVPVRDTEEPDFYVDEDLLSRIHHWSGSPMAHAVQLQLVQDFVTAIVLRASAKLQPGDPLPAWEDASDSLLGRMLTVAAGKDGDPEALLEETRDDPNKVLARFEHRTALGKEYVASVTEGSK